jgi:hypothetical protein
MKHTEQLETQKSDVMLAVWGLLHRALLQKHAAIMIRAMKI